MEGAADDPEHLAEEQQEEQDQASVPRTDVRPSRLRSEHAGGKRGQVPLPPLPPLDTSEFLAVNPPTAQRLRRLRSALQSTGSGSYDAIAREPEKSSKTPMIIAGVLVLAFAIVVAATQFGGSDETDAGSRRAARDQKTRQHFEARSARQPARGDDQRAQRHADRQASRTS